MAKKKSKNLPGMENVTIKELDELSEEYVKVRDRRMRLTEQEKEAQDALTAAMIKHKLKSYQYDGKTVTLIHSDKSQVKKNKGDDGESDNGDGDDEPSLVERGRRHLEGPAREVVEKVAEGMKA